MAERATQALRAGASAFLLKESAGEELVTAIHQALQGRVYLTPAVTQGRHGADGHRRQASRSRS